jgi:hypothetical protein
MFAAEVVSDPLRGGVGVDRGASSLFNSFMATSPLLDNPLRSNAGVHLLRL